MSEQTRAYGLTRRRHRKRQAERERLRARGRALLSYDSITVERGAAGGWIVTIDDAWTGEEQPTKAEAIRDAMERTQR